MHRCQGQPAAEELGLRNGELGLDECYLLLTELCLEWTIFALNTKQVASENAQVLHGYVRPL